MGRGNFFGFQGSRSSKERPIFEIQWTCYTIFDKGISYRGTVAVTKSGQSCIPWNRHLHTFTSDRFRFDGLDANYCRNPLGKRGAPWCYNSPTGKEDESWEYCEIEMCDKCLFRGVQLKTGDRFHDGCSMCICQTSGIKCVECDGGPQFTNEIGCYVKYKPQEHFPRCCPRIVCHGKDRDFNLTEYFNYLELVLRTHVAAQSHTNHTSNVGSQETNFPVLP
ncbi:uncharacterized protein LOC128548162 [Mercenaria mercenaria]|uniref:uncharacterized protein LOC128548162 n=1 Tax=Mercenaria mercenaria TaxID=6596 RepID=UPI00234FA2CF|nr:uncharacterized protein LOC128548162 [Mercenaria mercenaria]